MKSGYVSRYLSQDSFISDYKNNKITFRKPSVWEDPFENPVRNIPSQFTELREVYALCWTLSRSKCEEVFWKTHRYDSVNKTETPCCRISVNIKKLLQLVKKCLPEDNRKYHVVAKEIKYSKSRVELKNKINQFSKKYQNIVKVDEKLLKQYTKDYVSLLSFKRCAFQYEREFRIFVIAENDSPSAVNNNELTLYNFKWDEILKVITLQPFSVEELKSIDENKIEESISIEKEAFKNKAGTDIKIVKSRLYEL